MEWVCFDIQDRFIYFRGSYKNCCLVQEHSYAGLAVIRWSDVDADIQREWRKNNASCLY